MTQSQDLPLPCSEHALYSPTNYRGAMSQIQVTSSFSRAKTMWPHRAAPLLHRAGVLLYVKIPQNFLDPSV